MTGVRSDETLHHVIHMEAQKGEVEMKRVKFEETESTKGDIYKISYSRENSVEPDVPVTMTTRPEMFRQQSMQENDENEKRLGHTDGEKKKLLDDTPTVRSHSPVKLLKRSLSSTGSTGEAKHCTHRVKIERSESWIESIHRKSNNLETVKSWVKILGCCTGLCLLLLLGLGGTMLVLYFKDLISFGHHHDGDHSHNMKFDPQTLAQKSFEEAKTIALSSQPIASYQFHMDQIPSSELKEIQWVPQKGFQLGAVTASTSGCVTSHNGGRFIGFATVLLMYDKNTKQRTMTVSAVVKAAEGIETTLNKVSEPIPAVNVRQQYSTSKPVQITFSTKLEPGDQICIRAKWEQVKVSYIDNTLTLIKY